MKVQQFTIYARSAGVEISSYEKRQDGRPIEGRISLRFFKMESKGQQFRFVAEPWEGFELFRRIKRVYREGGKETLTHKYESSNGEIVTKLTVEKYERNNKAGYAMSIKRGDDGINVSISDEHFLYAGELLRHLSLTQAWVEHSE